MHWLVDDKGSPSNNNNCHYFDFSQQFQQRIVYILYNVSIYIHII